MKSIKTKERIGQGLYAIATILLIINIYQKGADIENRWIEIVVWSSFLFAAVYAISLSREKKKIEEDNGHRND